ncbi:MAG TPA: RNA polymerase sigma-70 factor [Cytophagaceae bacterium]|jgi:RNA polymerase sigma-70 factor (ECF subfamily)
MHSEPIDDLFLNPTKDTFEALFRKYYAPLCRSVHRIIQDKNGSEDIVQEVFASLWGKRNTIDVQSSIKSYLFRASMNAALNHLKKQKRWASMESEDESSKAIVTENVLEDIEGKELEFVIERTIAQLPTGCRTMFVMNRYDEMSYREIAEATQTSVKTVENQIAKALRVLRQALGSYIKVLIFMFLQLF